ncbi:MAG: ABC transporter permease [Tannerellaceae bacterium]|jgi:hypothetical protein|nr:ABC transporter permease [Tannerellaceae bacterium]
MKKELGRILIDVAKLVIGGVLLAGLMKQDIKPVLLFSIGGIVATSAIYMGLVLILWDEDKNKNKNN